MKKLISLITVIAILSTCAFAAPVQYSDPALMESSDAASYEPYPIKSNATSYTPWLTMYHMQRAEDADKGLRGGEGGQMIMSAAISPVNPNLVLFGTDMGGLWRSTDGGENWYSVTNNINMRAVMGIEFHPTKENLVYCIQSVKGTGLAKSMKNTKMDGLYRSKDGGRNWEQVLHALFLVNGASQELIQFDNSGNLYVLSREGVYKSTDDGESFTLIGTPDASTDVNDEENNEDTTDSEGNEVTVDTSTSGGVFALWVSGDGKTLITATSTSGISLSTNGGTNWTTKNVSENTTGAYSVAVDPKDEAHWYAVFTGESSRLYETKNSGTDWTALNSYYYADKNKAMVVKVSYPGDGNTRRLHLVYTNAAHQYRYSDDNAATWHRSGDIATVTEDTFTQSTGYNTEALEICESDPDIVFFSYGDVMYKSTDGGKTFFWSNAGYSGNYANGFVFDSQNRLWIPFTDRGLAVTDTAYSKGAYPTATKTTDNGTIGAVGIDPTNENNIYISKGGWSNQTLYKSTDGGSTWAKVPVSEGSTTYVTYSSSCKVIQFHEDYAENGIIYAGKYKSTDFGKTWTALSYKVWAISPLDNDIIYSAAKTSSSKNTVLRSTDCGNTWEEIITPFTNAEVVLADRFDKDVFWVGGYGGYVFKCTSSGSYTSYNKSNGLTPLGDATNSIYALAQNPNNVNHLLAGTNGPDAKTKTTGIYETYDGGTTWHVVKGLPSTRNIQTLEFTPAGDEVLIGTCSQGTFVYDFNKYKEYLAGTLTVDKSDEILLASDADKYRVMVNKNTVSFTDSEMPYLANGEIYVPVKKVMEEAGYSVSVNNNTLTAQKEDSSIELTAGSTSALADGEEVTLKSTPVIKNEIVFCTLDTLEILSGFDTQYNEALQRAEITYTTPEPEVIVSEAKVSSHERLVIAQTTGSTVTDESTGASSVTTTQTITADTTSDIKVGIYTDSKTRWVYYKYDISQIGKLEDVKSVVLNLACANRKRGTFKIYGLSEETWDNAYAVANGETNTLTSTATTLNGETTYTGDTLFTDPKKEASPKVLGGLAMKGGGTNKVYVYRYTGAAYTKPYYKKDSTTTTYTGTYIAGDLVSYVKEAIDYNRDSIYLAISYTKYNDSHQYGSVLESTNNIVISANPKVVETSFDGLKTASSSTDSLTGDFTYSAVVAPGGTSVRLICAIYDGDEKLIDIISSNTLTSGKDTLILAVPLSSYTNAASVKCYLWDGVTLVPYMNPIETTAAIATE